VLNGWRRRGGGGGAPGPPPVEKVRVWGCLGKKHGEGEMGVGGWLGGGGGGGGGGRHPG